MDYVWFDPDTIDYDQSTNVTISLTSPLYEDISSVIIFMKFFDLDSNSFRGDRKIIESSLDFELFPSTYSIPSNTYAFIIYVAITTTS